MVKAEKPGTVEYTELEKETIDEKEEAKNFNNATSLYSTLMFSWLSKTLSLGYKRPLEMNDLPYYAGQEPSREIADTFEKTWSCEIKNSLSENRPPKLWTTVMKSIGYWNLTLVFFTAALAAACRVIQQLLLIYILTLMAAGTRDVNLWLFTGGFIMSLFVEMVVKNQYFYFAQLHLRATTTSGLITLVHQKILSKRSYELADVTAGHVINLISKDLQPLQFVANFLPIALVGCFEFIAMGALLWYFISWMALAGMFYLVLFVVFQLASATPIRNFRRETQSVADRRMAIIKNVITGIRTVKMNSWEWLFERIVKNLRRKEIQAVQKKNIIYGILRAVRNSYPAMASFLSIVSLWGAGIDLTPAIVFTTSLMFNTLSGNVVEAIIEGAYNFSLIKATFSRLESFLTKRDLQSSPKEASLYNYECGEGKPHGKDLKQEIPASTTNLATPEIKFNGPGIEMKNVCSHIKTKEDSSMISLLNEISLRCNENDLIAITGSSGSGKSSVLGAIIGEIPVTSGEISVTGRIAYMPQNPWLFSGTVQENILFGNDYNEEKYHATIEACALIDDLEHLPLGDMTHVGESGVTLSGGQRARVSLARTVYSDADIFLLDSPLKAVDAKVGESIYKNCISGLLSTRPRIHITHHKKYLSNSTVVLKMENGWIVSRDKSQYEIDEKDVESETKRPTIADGELDKRKDTNIVPSSGNKGISTAEEDRETGSVPIRTYMTFLRAGASAISILLCYIAAFIPGAVNLGLGFWLANFSRKTVDSQQEGDNIYSYIDFQFVLFFSSLLSVFYLQYLTVNCARHLHDSMFGAILKAPALFFDTNPAGRILNRFSKDTECMDEMLPRHLTIMSFLISDNFYAFLLISVTDYWMALAYLCFLVPAVLLVRYFLRSSVETKRLEAISASSVYSCVDETIVGITVIRNFGREKQFQETLFRLQDKNNTAFMSGVGVSRWLAMRLEGAVLLLLTGVILLVVFTKDAATAGLTVLYTRLVLMAVLRIAVVYTFLETEMTSVERVITYSKLEPNPVYKIDAVPPANWPEDGSLKFEDCSLVYYPGGPNVLKNISLDIKPGEKIGITGRTGAGKSSLVSALFRMPEPGGSIIISGIPVTTLNVKESRKALTIVPQQAFLFGGTMRQNIDPEGKHSDKEIWDILERVNLKAAVEENQEKLDYWVTENGINFSGGEQQLICIARALLQDRKIVVLDEALASMDLETDQLIQGILKKELTDRTVVTIAHRLDSILDYDRIIVIDEGQVVEDGSPESLLKKEDGRFRQLYERYRMGTLRGSLE